MQRAIFLVVAMVLAGTDAAIVYPGEKQPEDTVTKARYMAIHKQRNEALALLEAKLSQSPDDTDARVLYGIILSWEGRYEESRKELGQVLATNGTHGDALPALINVELWSDHPERAEQLTREGLRTKPTDPTLLIGRARALKTLSRNRESVQVLDRLLELEPRNQEALQLRHGLQESSRQWEAGLGHSYEWFDDDRDAWQETQLSLKRRTSLGSLITRFSHASRFGLGSQQTEVDFYPRFRSGTYAYVNLGFSPDKNLYPSYRFGTDLYQSLGYGLEGSAGFRRLGFSSPVNIYTGSLSKYYGNWLFTGRVYLTPDLIGTSRSFSVSSRRYFGEGIDYVGFRFGWGASPTEIYDLSDITILDSSSLMVEFNRKLGGRWTVNLRSGVSHEDRIGSSSLRRYLADGGIYFRF